MGSLMQMDALKQNFYHLSSNMAAMHLVFAPLLVVVCHGEERDYRA